MTADSTPRPSRRSGCTGPAGRRSWSRPRTRNCSPSRSSPGRGRSTIGSRGSRGIPRSPSRPTTQPCKPRSIWSTGTRHVSGSGPVVTEISPVGAGRAGRGVCRGGTYTYAAGRWVFALTVSLRQRGAGRADHVRGQAPAGWTWDNSGPVGRLARYGIGRALDRDCRTYIRCVTERRARTMDHMHRHRRATSPSMVTTRSATATT